MNDLLKALFLDNPCLPEQIYAFCSRLPEFREAERSYDQAAARLRSRLGHAELEAFEDTLNWYLAQYVHAYYLFGLGLRQEVLTALGPMV